MSKPQNERQKLLSRLWIRAGAAPEIHIHILDDRSRRLIQLSIEDAARLRNILENRLGEARKFALSTEGSAHHA